MTGFAGDRVLKAETPRQCLNHSYLGPWAPEWLALELVTCIPDRPDRQLIPLSGVQGGRALPGPAHSGCFHQRPVLSSQ